MKLTKEQALELFAILTHYETINENTRDNMRDLRFDIKEFILTDDEEEDDEETYTKRKSDKDPEEEDESETEKSEEDEDPSYEDPEEDPEDEKADCTVCRSDIVRLSRCSAVVVNSSEFERGEKVKIEFDYSDGSYISSKTLLLITQGGSERYIEPILFLKRRGNEISIGEANQKYGKIKEWHTFEVTKFPKEWTKLIPIDKLVEIESRIQY